VKSQVLAFEQLTNRKRGGKQLLPTTVFGWRRGQVSPGVCDEAVYV